MLCCPTSTECLTFQQRINNVPTVFDLLEGITSQACGHLPPIGEALACPNMCQQASLSEKCTEEKYVNDESGQNRHRLVSCHATGKKNTFTVISLEK